MSVKATIKRIQSIGVIALFLDAFRRWSSKRAASKGAALALYMIFSLAPILVLLMVLGGWFFSAEALQDELLKRIRDIADQRSADAVQNILANVQYARGGTVAAWASLAMLAFSSTTAFTELKRSLDEIWDAPGKSKAGLLQTAISRLLSFVVVLSLAAVLLASLFVDAVLRAMQQYWHLLFDEATFSLAAQLISSAFSFFVVVLLVAVVLKTLPSAELRWRDVWPGALLTAVLFHLGKTAIGLYLSRGNIISSYGAAGSVIALLLWIYFSALIFFFGAAFAREYWGRYGSGRTLLPSSAQPRPNAQAAPPSQKVNGHHQNADSDDQQPYQHKQAVVPD